MLEALRKLLTGEGSSGRAAPVDEKRRLRVATCALLLEAVHADDAVDDGRVVRPERRGGAAIRPGAG